ncbi:MAG: hypothetical protein COT43_09830 [Candidatus Marinimicrobia bacterium CG08_land_8_20_14_0_20_45_22]|nr:MAG: hypothetical protein COT43_09830 [Candidatus Marinimicrobia bacterium CG08_land_8_20_14_0_20_45_22]
MNITALNSDYGAFLSLQRNTSEHVGLRVKTGWSHLEGSWKDASHIKITERTNLLSGDLAILYYLAPCAPASPYIFGGVGGSYRMVHNGQTGFQDKREFGSQVAVGAGIEYKMNRKWSFTSEVGYHVTSNSKLDGAIVPTEVNGRDSYLVFAGGFHFFFRKGEPSKQCEPCPEFTPGGIDLTDYNRIENLIVKHIPKEVTNQVVIDRYIMEFKNDLLVLVGVNFAFDKADLLPESYPVLDKSVVLLKDKPGAKFEI